MRPGGSWPGNQRGVLDCRSYLGAWSKCRLYLGRSGWGLRFRISAKPQAWSAVGKNAGSVAGQGQQVNANDVKAEGLERAAPSGPGLGHALSAPFPRALGPLHIVYSVTQPHGVTETS